MEQKIQKEFFVFKIFAFDSETANPQNPQRDSSDRQSMY